MQNNRKHLILSILCLLLFACAESNKADSMQPNMTAAGIVGGDNVDEDSEFARTVVMIRTKLDPTAEQKSINYDICTGTIIANNIVLTAAHCVVGKAKDMEVVYTTNLQDSNSEVVSVGSFIVHRNYKGTNNFNLNSNMVDEDIALIKIIGSIPANYKVTELSGSMSEQERFNFISVGFGRNTGVLNLPENTDFGSGILRFTNVTGISYKPSYNYFLSDQTSGKGVCNGDSGGPALILEDGQHKILGITKAIFSRSNMKLQKPDADSCKFNGMFMNVQFYRQWISDSIQTLNHKN